MDTGSRHIQAMDKIAALVNVRERTAKETCERLLAAGFTQEECEEAVSSAIRVGMVSDERYARAFIRGKSHMGWGRMKIVQRLQLNGVSQDVIDLCANEFREPDSEFQAALSALEKRPSKSKDPFATYMRRLLSKGYSYEICLRAVKSFLAKEPQ